MPLDLDPSTNELTFYGNPAANGSVGFFAVYNDAGQVLHRKVIEQASLVTPKSTAATNDNGFAILGTYNADFDADFGSNTSTVASVGFPLYNDLFILKLNEDLSLQWSKTMAAAEASNQGAFCIRQKPNGNLISTGYVHSATIDLDPGAGVFNVVHDNWNGSNGFIQELDATGNFVWGEQAISPYDCDIKSVAVLNNDSWVFIANADYQVTFSPHLNYAVPLFNENVGSEFMIGKIVSGNPTALAEVVECHIGLFPQPASAQVSIANLPTAATRYVIYDARGRALEEGRINSQQLVLNTSSFAQGQYIFAVKDNSGNLLTHTPLVIGH